MDIVKRAYLNTLNREPDDCPLPAFRQKVREEIIGLIDSGVYGRRQWPREFGPMPVHMRTLRALKEHVYKKQVE